MRRVFHIALASAACAAATTARAQFRANPMILYAPGTGTDVVPYASSATATESGLLVLRSDSTMSSATYLRHHDMLTRLAAPVAWPLQYESVAAGRLAQNGSDDLTDVAYAVPRNGELIVAFGNEQQPPPGVTHSYPVRLDSASRINFAHLLPRDGDFVVVPYMTDVFDFSEVGYVDVFDFALGESATRSWTSTGRHGRGLPPEEVLPIRLGAAARAYGVDDLYLPGAQSVQIWENLWPPPSPPPVPGLVDVVLASPVLVDAAGKLPSGVPGADCMGAAPLDADSDGVVELVVSLSWLSRIDRLPPPGHLLLVESTGTVSSLASGAWTDLNQVLGLADPVIVRPLVLEGVPAVAVWDRELDEIVIVRAQTGSTMPVVAWRGTTAGRHVRDIRLADVVGSNAPDLVVDGTETIEVGYTDVPPAILVYPDLGDASPVLAWAPGSPGTPERGEDHLMAVEASDADAGPGFPLIDWIVGDPWLDPVVSNEPAYVHPGTSLCGTPPQKLRVTVRAMDEYGVFDEIGADLDVSESPPRVAISGAFPPDRLVLPPGEAIFTLEGSAWSRCTVSFAWEVSPPWPAGTEVSIAGGQGTTLQSVHLPETSYPDLLAREAPVVTLTATDTTEPSAQQIGVTTMPLEIDASGLVDVVSHESDLAAIAEGEVAMLETRIASRLEVPLASVHVVHALAGLVPAGAAQASGAAIVETLEGGAEVVLDALPPSSTEVVVRLPVRTSGGRAASAVEVRSSGGHLLTPSAAVPVETSPMPGCGCGSSPAGSALALLALAGLGRRSRTSRLLPVRPAAGEGAPLT